MNRILLFVTIFSFGYMFNDVLKEFDLDLFNKDSSEIDSWGNTDVLGIDWEDLRRDKNFKKALKWHVEGCTVLSLPTPDLGGQIYCGWL